jgi:hypothetical protein
MFNTPEILISLAEVAIALAGFSAIVVVMKRTTSGNWARIDADRFHGMVIHSVFAASFCFLPSIINVLIQDPVTAMHIACGVLGLQIIGHCLVVMFYASAGSWAKAFLFLGVLFGLLQFSAFSDWGVQRELDLYIVGVLWHILQGGFLFTLLVWIPMERIDE